MRATPIFLIALLAFLVATPGVAYTIVLKDGSHIQAKEKYRLDESGRAIIVLQSGTHTFLNASEIDVERTEAMNEGNLGTAWLLEDGAVKNLTAEPPKRQESLGDLIVEGRTGSLSRPEAQRPLARGPELPRTRAGFPDLNALDALPFPDFELVSQARALMGARGVAQVRVLEGSQKGRPLLDVRANSEAAVFRALEAAAELVLQLAQRNPQRGRLEVLLRTQERELAGQFLLTPELARDLVDGDLEVSEFFIRHVQF